MNWKEMHIGIDLGLQKLNSNFHGKLLPEHKDYYLNRVIIDLLTNNKDSAQGNVPILTDSELQSKYLLLEPFIKEVDFDLVRGSKFDYGFIPKGFTDDIKSGFLYDGVTYQVVEPGTGLDLTLFGGSNNPAKNSTFVCNISNITSVHDGSNFTLAVAKSGKYKIISPGSFDFTTIGAVNSQAGTEFISTEGYPTTGAGVTVKPLRHIPIWGTGSVLRALTPLDMLMYYSTYSNVDVGYSFTTGMLIKGTTYRVVTGGTIDNLITFGAISNAVQSNYIFTSTKTGVPNWSGSSLVLTETRDFPNRLIEFKDIEDALQHGFGTTETSPICCMVDGKIRIYHLNKFKINYVKLSYIRTPVKIDSVRDINSDTNVGIHGYIVDRTIQRIAGHKGQPEYQTIRHENEKIE